MTRQPPTTPSRSPQPRRFTLGARLWMLALLGLVAVPLYLGQAAVALLVLASGFVGFLIVFDARRPWWGPEVRASEALQRQRPSDRRSTIALLGLLVLVTIVTLVVVLSSQH